MPLPAAGPTDCSSGFSQRIYNDWRYDYPWAAGATYAVGHLGCPTAPNGFGYKVTAITTGITAGSEPSWPVVLTNTVVDGGVTWTCQDIANPSGKGGGFVALLSAAQLGNLQSLSYAMAKAIADEIAADYCSAEYNTAAAQSIVTATNTIINFDHKVTDTDNAVTTGASWVFTVPTGKGGDYDVSAAICFATAPGTNPNLYVYKNGSAYAILWDIVYSAAGGAAGAVGDTTLTGLVAGDTIQIKGNHNHGSNVALTANAFQNRITICRRFGS